MIMYNQNTVNKYLKGEDIVSFELEDLENDESFMLDVLKTSLDYKMFDFCSDELKQDHSFIISVLNLFCNEKAFINELAQNYLKSIEENSITYNEIIVLMFELLKKTANKSTEHGLFGLLCLKFYTRELAENNLIISNQIQKQNTNNYGLGFLFALEKWGNSPTIMNYLAEKYLDSLLFEDDYIKLEKYIHQKYPHFNECDGIIKFLINHIAMHDIYLANYFEIHPELLNESIKKLSRIKSNWKLYIDVQQCIKVDIIMEHFDKFLEENDTDPSIDFLNELYFIARRLGLGELFDFRE